MVKPVKILLPAVLLLLLIVVSSCSSTVIRASGPTDTTYGVQLTDNGKNVNGWARIEYTDSTGTTVRLDSQKVSWTKTVVTNTGQFVSLRAVNLSNCCKITVTLQTRGVDGGQISDSTGRGAVASISGTVSSQ